MTDSASQKVSRRIARESFLYSVGNIASRVIGFLLIPLYSRFLTPGEYGTIELVELATQVLSLLLGFGITGAALVRVFQDHDTDEWRNSVSSTSALGCTAINLAGALLTALAAGPISRAVFGSQEYARLIAVTAAALALGNIIENSLCYVRLKGRAGFRTIYALVALLATVLLNIWFIAYMRLGVWGFVLSKLIVVTCGSAYLTFLILRETGIHWNSRVAISMVRFGAPLGLSYVSFFVLHFADRFFLGRYSTLTAVGNYALAYRFAFLVNALLGEPFGRSWSVTLYGYLKTSTWREEFRRISIYLALALSVAGLGISLFSDKIMYYAVPPSYYEAFLVIPVLVAAYALRDFGDFLREMLFIEKRSDLVGFTAAGVAVLNIVLNFLWIPSHGIAGAAWATFVSWLIYTLAITLLVERQLTVGLPYRNLLTLAVSTSAAYLLASVLNGHALVLRFAFDILVFGTFLFAIGVSGLLSASEKEAVKRMAVETLARVRKGQLPF